MQPPYKPYNEYDNTPSLGLEPTNMPVAMPTPPIPTPPTQPKMNENIAPQMEIPDWLKQMSEQGYGAQWMRSQQMLQGLPMAEQANIASRQIQEQGFLSGATASGFGNRAIDQINLDKAQSLEKLRLGLESKNEALKRDAMSQVKDIEFQNKVLTSEWERAAQAEELARQQREQQMKEFKTMMETQNRGWEEQFGAFATSLVTQKGGEWFTNWFMDLLEGDKKEKLEEKVEETVTDEVTEKAKDEITEEAGGGLSVFYKQLVEKVGPVIALQLLAENIPGITGKTVKGIREGLTSGNIFGKSKGDVKESAQAFLDRIRGGG